MRRDFPLAIFLLCIGIIIYIYISDDDGEEWEEDNAPEWGDVPTEYNLQA